MAKYSTGDIKTVGLIFSDIIINTQDPVGLKIKKLVKSSPEDCHMFIREYCCLKSYFVIICIRALDDIKDDKEQVNAVLDATIESALKFFNLAGLNISKDYFLKRVNAYFAVEDIININFDKYAGVKELKKGLNTDILIANKIDDETLYNLMRETWIYVQRLIKYPEKT